MTPLDAALSYDTLFSAADFLPLIFPPPNPYLKLSLIIPVRNEAADLIRTLAALASQVDALGNALNPAIYEVLVLANNCTDDTAGTACDFARRHPHLALHVAEGTLPPSLAHVGAARRLLMDAACRRLLSCGRERGVIASTDGDTRAAPDWVSQMLREIAAGADAVGGRIRVERQRGQDREARLYGLRDAAYQRGLARLESLVDPDPADPWPRHHQFFGGSLGITAEAYCRVGGLPPLPCLEDVALEDALRRADACIRHSPQVRVTTSARQEGRTPLGLSSQLREWGEMGRSGHAHWVQQPAAVTARFRSRRIFRRCWRMHRAESRLLTDLAEALAVPLSVLQDGLADPSQPFGVLWAAVMAHHQQPDGAWARRWPLVPITEALPDLRRRFNSRQRQSLVGDTLQDIQAVGVFAVAAQRLQSGEL